MAVFGVPRVREDDALRAVRAAAEIRERLPEVGAETRRLVRDAAEAEGGAEDFVNFAIARRVLAHIYADRRARASGRGRAELGGTRSGRTSRCIARRL